MSIELMKYRRAKLAKGLASAVILAVIASGPGLAHDGSKHKNRSSSLGTPVQTDVDEGTKVKLLDLELVDRSGKPVRFQSEAVADRIVVIDFVYTTCTTICPILSAVMAQVQDRLGARLGTEVRPISISIDPIRDTPERLDAYARKFGAGPEWIWLTGRKPAVDQVLIGLNTYTPNFIDHASSVLIGDARSNTWTRLFGFPGPEDILARVNELVSARNPVQTSSKHED
jgi:protein SCO1/2